MATESEKDLLPHYLKASTPELLQGEMLKNNLRLQSFVRYQDIQQLNDGSWICWYYEKSMDFNSVMKLVNSKKDK